MMPQEKNKPMTKSWLGHGPLAEEHRKLTPKELIDITVKYVEYINYMARIDDTYAPLLTKRHQWPALIGKEPNFDNQRHREIAHKHLRVPKFEPVSDSREVAPWAKKPGHDILRIINEHIIAPNNPCAIVWADEAFIERDTSVDGTSFSYCRRLSRQHPPLKPQGLAPVRVMRGEKVLIQRNELRMLADVITCFYGPEKYRISVYSHRLADFIISLDEELRGRKKELFDIIKAVVESATSGNGMLRYNHPLKNDKASVVAEAVQQAWMYAPLSMKGLPEPQQGKNRGGRVFHFHSLTDEMGQVPKGKWFEHILPCLINATLAELKLVRELPNEEVVFIADFPCSGEIVFKQDDGYADISDLNPDDLMDSEYRYKAGRPPKRCDDTFGHT